MSDTPHEPHGACSYEREPHPSRITVRTRTGKTLHLAHPEGTTTTCGRWLKASVRIYQVEAEPTCQSCIAIARKDARRARDEWGTPESPPAAP